MTQQATFGAGCFWGVEEDFRVIPGVLETKVGYMGGTLKNPTYEDVCSDTSGHAEVVHLSYDPDVVSYQTLLKVFWENHNPTTMNQQGPDYGSQYRSVIFTYSPEQVAEAEGSKLSLEMSGKWKSPIVTQIVPAETFYPAEEHHQKYLLKRGQGSCHI